MSEYFGAIKVDELNEQVEPDFRLNCKQFFLNFDSIIRGMFWGKAIEYTCSIQRIF
jgi:hypothetical protein